VGTGTGVWVHNVLSGQYLYEGSPVRASFGGEQVQVAEGGWDGVGDGELRKSGASQYADIESRWYLHTDCSKQISH